MRMTISDQLLVDLLVNKDRQRFEFLYDTYSPCVHGSVLELVEEKDMAVYVLKKALGSAYYTIHHYKKHRRKLFTWLLHIAVRLWLDKVKAIETWPSADQLQEASGGLWCVLQGMAEAPREVIRLTYDEGCSKIMAAQKLGIPVERIDDLLQTGLRQLQDYMNKCYWQ
jgi:DNA-directed RNA polymerase specialized sigma24 family protein